MKQVSVNATQCRNTGLILKKNSIRPSFYEREFLSFKADRETKLRLYLFSAAICHQTYSLANRGLNLYGWDFLEYGFLQMIKNHSFLFKNLNPVDCSVKNIREHLAVTFSENGDAKNCTLDNLEERSEMLEEICNVAITDFDGTISALLEQSEGKLYNSGRGAYEVLGRFKGFNDPLKKKITFFLKLATDAGVFNVADPENIIPIMDYHMQRVLMRLGCVEINDKRLYTDLINRNPAGSDKPVREACIEAIKIIADVSEHGIFKMNDFFWPLGRSCCNENPLCVSNTCEKTPCTFFTVVDLKSHESCIFEKICKGSTDEYYRKLWQPVVETNFY
jgi:hypothetical protein